MNGLTLMVSNLSTLIGLSGDQRDLISVVHEDLLLERAWFGQSHKEGDCQRGNS